VRAVGLRQEQAGEDERAGEAADEQMHFHGGMGPSGGFPLDKNRLHI
jgi:hypothetical protein